VFVVYIYLYALSLSRSLCGTRVLGDTPGLIFVTERERERASERARHTKSHVNTIHKNRIISYFTSHIPLKNKITQRPARLCFPPVLFLILLLVAPTHTQLLSRCVVVVWHFCSRHGTCNAGCCLCFHVARTDLCAAAAAVGWNSLLCTG
jgi:hypothetical protein